MNEKIKNKEEKITSLFEYNESHCPSLTFACKTACCLKVDRATGSLGNKKNNNTHAHTIKGGNTNFFLHPHTSLKNSNTQMVVTWTRKVHT